MDDGITSDKIIKIAIGVFALIIVIVFVSLLLGTKKEPTTTEVQNIVLSRETLTMTVGSTYTLSAVVSPSTAINKNVTYMSNNSSVATVGQNGTIYAYSVGEARITAMTSNGKQDQCTIKVIEDTIPVTSIEIETDDVTLVEGESTTLKLVVQPNNTTDHNYTWTSSDTSVVTVDSNGMISAKKPGTALITVMTKNKKIAICDVEVKPKVTSLKLDKKEAKMSVGDTLTLKATIAPAGSTATVEWNSSNPSVASVNSNGKVTAKGAGTVTITAKAGTFTATCKITVKIVSTSDIYTFKYVEDQMSKPLIRCNTYTAEDRVRLQDQLKRAIEKVGYGTRAGVVEAARFLVGGLDYRIPYMGPKTREVDPTGQLGMYNRVGLNIGNSSGWGCRVSGMTQGMDCNNFVIWAFRQNGMSIYDYYSSKNTYPSTEAVNRIRPGDLMLSPCYSSCRFDDHSFSHVGIVIGVEEDKIYVAESTTGTINSIVITILYKNNMPTKYKFATVRLYDYPSEGKLTDMWD